MISPVLRFPSGRNFKVETSPSSKDFCLFFLDKEKLFSYFAFEKKDPPPCLLLPLPKTEPWGKKGELLPVILLSGSNREKAQKLLANYPELPQNSSFLFLTPSTKKGYDEVLENDHLSCYYTLYQDRWYPVSYTPFQGTIVELEGEYNYDFIAFGSESNLSVAVLEGDAIHLSPVFGRLLDWQQLEASHQWMENQKKAFITKGVIFHEYYHESLLHTYLSKYGQKSAYTHTEAHFANVLFDNHFSSTPLLGIIFDEEDHTSHGTIEGSDIVYGTMSQVNILASWRPIPVPGNASTYLEPWRITLAVLREITKDLDELDIPFMEQLRQKEEIRYVINAINKRIINVISSSSMTHILIALFELLDYRSLVEEYDMVNKRLDELFLSHEEPLYDVGLIQEDTHTYLDTYDLFKQVLADISSGKNSLSILHQAIHSLFGNTAKLVKTYADQYQEKRVALSGNLFIHPHLLQLMEYHLQKHGLTTLIHKTIPTGDSSVALGALLHILAKKEAKSIGEE
ncbi:MAG: hypothetical protein N2314_04030 [Brevinematales bacterium]|nr:hypothetical protein [Brevinematales bacterium]